jgi:hypothetical protein
MTPSPAALRALIEALEKADGSDLGLDRSIHAYPVNTQRR